MIAPAGADSEYERSTIFSLGTGSSASRAFAVSAVRAGATFVPTTSGALTPAGSPPATAKTPPASPITAASRRATAAILARGTGRCERTRWMIVTGSRSTRVTSVGAASRATGGRLGPARQRRGVGAERDRGRGGVAAHRRLPREEDVDDLHGLRRSVRRDRRKRRSRLMCPAETRREPILAFERQPSREELEEDAAERVEIRGRPGLASGGLLRRPVLGRPGEHARHRRGRRPAGEPRETEVGDHDTAGSALDEHVGRGEVAMDDSTRVRVGERGGDRRAEPSRLVPAERATADDRVEAVALDELEDEHRLPAVLEDVVEPDDVRVLEPGECRSLALEARAELLVVGDPGVQHLERDIALRGARRGRARRCPCHRDRAGRAGDSGSRRCARRSPRDLARPRRMALGR